MISISWFYILVAQGWIQQLLDTNLSIRQNAVDIVVT
jgi:hypothetical protein